LPFEAELHTPLVCSPRILQSERHFHGAITAVRGDERDGGLVCLGEGYLVITRVRVQKTQEPATGSEVNDMINTGKRGWIFRTCLIQARVIDTYSPLLVLLWYKNQICYLFLGARFP
jgi:hypothetical protein